MKPSIARRSGSFTAPGALFEDGETGPFRRGFLDAGISSLLAKFQENLQCNLIHSSIGDLKTQAVKIRPIRGWRPTVFARRPLPHVEEPNLPRRDRPKGQSVSGRTRSDRRSRSVATSAKPSRREPDRAGGRRQSPRTKPAGRHRLRRQFRTHDADPRGQEGNATRQAIKATLQRAAGCLLLPQPKNRLPGSQRLPYHQKPTLRLGRRNGRECPAKRLRRQAYKFSSRKP